MWGATESHELDGEGSRGPRFRFAVKGRVLQSALLTMKTTYSILLLCVSLLHGFALDEGVPGTVRRLSPHLQITYQAVNHVKVGSGNKALWFYRSSESDASNSSGLYLTHARRDVLPAQPADWVQWQVAAPAAERAFFEAPGEFWTAFRTKRFHDYDQQSTKVLGEPFPVSRWLKPGDEVGVGDFKFEVLSTPGYTRGAITYLGEIDGRRVAFTGDLVYAGGRLIDLYSFQDSIPEVQIRGYHGYAARLADLVSSLSALKAWNPDIIVPTRGPIIENPSECIDQLVDRVRRLYRNYLSTNALNWYFKEERMKASGRRVLGSDQEIQLMPYSTHLATPDWILSQSTSRVIVSDDGYGFLLDCGYQRIIDTVDAWISQGLIRGIEGIFVTHFHDDHADQVQAARVKFQCPVYALKEYEDVLEHPSRYHLPAMTANPIPDVQGMNDGQVIRWRGFDLTFHYYPGQAFHHGGLYVEKENEAPIFFIGDSFSPSGMDDYCLLNRNLVRKDLGYFLCLRKLRAIGGEYWLINEHIPHIFRFSDVELGYLEHRYSERYQILEELLPWDDPNYGVDEQWAVFYPYGARVSPGASKELQVRITNHSPQARQFTVRPRGFGGVVVDSQSHTLTIAARSSGNVSFPAVAPQAPGNYLVTADVSSSGMHFESWIEAMLEVE